MDIKKYLNNIAKSLEYHLKANIQQFVYDNYTPVQNSEYGDDYIRHYGLINSVRVRVIDKGGKYSIQAYFSKEYLENDKSDSSWSTHSSGHHYFNVAKWKGNDKGSFMYIPYFVNEGFHYSFTNAPVVRQRPHFMQRTVSDIANQLDMIFDNMMDDLFGMARKMN